MIIIIEDTRFEADLLKILLDGKHVAGHPIECHIVTTITQAYTFLHTVTPEHVEAIIVDRILGTDDGLTLIHTLRAHQVWKNAIIIVWSQHDDTVSIREAFTHGADAFISKQRLGEKVGSECIAIIEQTQRCDETGQPREQIYLPRG